MAYVTLGPPVAGFVLTGKKPTRERHPRKYAQILPFAFGKDLFFRRLVDAVVYDLDYRRVYLRRLPGLVDIAVGADGNSKMPNAAGLDLIVQHRP